MKKFVALLAVAALVAFAAPAFAANPFMDVPMNHWAYDAVSQLAARGIVTGYPDGAFKGEWKATRYEMASVVARALAYVDMNKAGKEDLELLKRLVVEFKDELDALGVKVEDLDARVAVLEDDIGGWKLWGELRFDAKWADNGWPPTSMEEPSGTHVDIPLNAYTTTGDTDFNMSRYRLWITKRIDDKLKFIGRVGGPDLSWQRYYVEARMPWDSTLWVGKWLYDWEDDSGLYVDNDAWFTDRTLQGFYWNKSFAQGDFSMFVAHEETSLPDYESWGSIEDVLGSDFSSVNVDGYMYGARLNYHFNDKFRMAGQALWRTFDEPMLDDLTEDVFEKTVDTMNVYWADFGVKFTPNIELKGAYFWQSYTGLNNWDILTGINYDDPIDDLADKIDLVDHDPNAWKIILDVKQEATGFTSAWLEYAQFDKHFMTFNPPYDDYTNGWLWGTITPSLTGFGLPYVGGLPWLGAMAWGGLPADADAILVHLNQKWDDKWETFQRYVKFDLDPVPFSASRGEIAQPGESVIGAVDADVTEWNLGVRYWYTPNLMFELSYSSYKLDGSLGWTETEYVDDSIAEESYGGSASVEDNMIRFRTWVWF